MAAKLHKSQYLLINTCYWCGNLPFKFDLYTGKLLLIETKWEKIRWYAVLGLNFVIKLLMCFALVRDIIVRDFDVGSPLALLRFILVISFLCLGFLDFHSSWKSSEMVVTMNSTLRFHKEFQSKSKTRKLSSFFSRLTHFLFDFFRTIFKGSVCFFVHCANL